MLVNVKDLLDDLRSRAGETHAQSADRLGVSVHTYRSWISQRRPHVSMDKCQLIALSYGVPESVVRLSVGALPIRPYLRSMGSDGALADGWRRLRLLQNAECAHDDACCTSDDALDLFIGDDHDEVVTQWDILTVLGLISHTTGQNNKLAEIDQTDGGDALDLILSDD